MTNPAFQAYIKRVIERSLDICKDGLRSVVLFGSAASAQFEEGVSDIDLILVVADDIENQVIAKLEATLQRLEAAHGPLKNRSHFLNVFASRTALFKSHFIVRQSTLALLEMRRLFWEAEGFSLAFGRFLLPLAPSGLVVRNMLTSGLVVYGENVLPRPSSINLESSTFARFFLVSLVMSVFGALSTLLFSDGTMFSLESAKWYFLNRTSYTAGRNVSVQEAVRFMQGSAPRLFLQRFLELRQSYHRSLAFSLACPLFLMYTFLSTTRRKRWSFAALQK